MTSVFSWQNSVNSALLLFVPRPNFLVTPGILTSYLCIPIPYDEKDFFFFFLFGVSFIRSCRSSQNHLTSASSALVVGASTWVNVVLNGLPWKPTEIILSFLRLPKYCIFNSLVDFEGYSVSSKGFLSTVVDIMIILIKFAHSSSF